MPPTVPISKTKIIPPHRRPELLSRGRLLRDITSYLDRKLIIISAPAGYGKTTLLVDLANSTRMPVCWLSLDPLDRDPQRFTSYLVAALSERFPGLQAPMQPLLSNLRSIEDDLEELVVTLTNELYSQVEDEFIFVVDDFHLLDEHSQAVAVLNRFLQLADDNCHVILATRTLPDLPDLTLMVAREQTEGLDQSELAFQPEEIQAFFHQSRGRELTEQQALKLFEHSGGWITGIILSDQAEPALVPGIDTFTYLGRQVLDQQPKALQEFLLRTSLPEEFNSEVCEAILSPPGGRHKSWLETINTLLEKNLFILRVGTGGEWIRYHPLFREFLQARFRQEYPEEVKPILERLADFYEARCEWEKAYFTCQQLDQPERLASLVEHAGTPMLQHAFTTLEAWANALPSGLVSSRPGLISLRGAMAIMRGELRDAVNLLNSAEKIYRQQGDLSDLALVLTRRATAYRLMGKYDLALQHADEVIGLTNNHAQLQATYAEALRIKGSSLFRLGHSMEAVDYFERSLALFTALKETTSIAALLVATGTAHSVLGNIDAANSAFGKALEIWQAEKNLPQQAEVLNNIANMSHQAGEYERAVDALEKALSLARQSRYQRAEALILLSMGDIYAEVEDYEAAGLAYAKAQPIADQWPGSFIDTYLTLMRASLAVLQQDISLARTILQSARRRLQGNPSLYEKGLWALIEGRVNLLAGKLDQASINFAESKRCFAEDGRKIETCWARTWLASTRCAAGKIDSAASELLDLTESNNIPSHPALMVVAQAEPWLKVLRNDSGTSNRVDNMLDRAARLEKKLPGIRRSIRRIAKSIDMPGPGLVVKAFGRGEVQVNGRVVSSSEWSTQSVRELFFYFLCKGTAVTKEQVAAALWPGENDPQAIKQRFKAYIFRLRRATRRDVVVFDDEYYGFNFSLDYEYDVEAFETFLARARSTRDPGEKVDNYLKAVELAQKSYLAEVNLPWVLGERERLDQVLLGALMELSELQLTTRKLDDACSTAQRALLVDPYREEAYRLLMRVHSASSDRPAIHRQYQACVSALAEIGLSPSLETQQIYQKLVK